MKNILIVDDDVHIGNVLEETLSREGYGVTRAYSGTEALLYLSGPARPDLILLDLMLPGLSGEEVLAQLTETQRCSGIPVIVLSAKTDVPGKVKLLLDGAVDYITKPFRPLELIARVKAQLRRFTKYNNLPAQEADPDTISISGLTINKRDHTCTLNEKPLALTPTEFSILWSLCKNRGEVVSSDRLFFDVWGEKYYSSNNNTIMVHIRHLREKMNDSSEKPKYIKTVWGVGYKIE